MFLCFEHVTFTHEQAATPLFMDLTLRLDRGWTGVVGANGAGKTTLLRLAAGELAPQAGSVRLAGRAAFCAQRTDQPPQELPAFLQADDRAAHRLRGQLAIAQDWAARWSGLSHGERKRAQIAAALWQDPDLLALDEPTNHVDTQARDPLAQALAAFRGIGLLVSHDRALLDQLCFQCLFLEPPEAALRPGGYTRASAQALEDRQADLRRRAVAEQSLAHLEQELRRRSHIAAGADAKRSKRGIAAKDHDAKERIQRARTTGKDGRPGSLKRQIQGRARHLRQEIDGMPLRKEHESGIWLPGEVSRRDFLFSVPAGAVELGGRGQLSFPDLRMGPADRIGVVGPNGAGKSTLLRHILKHLSLEPGRVLHLPQEIEARESRRILKQVRALNPADLGRAMTLVSRLGSRPKRLLETAEPSPGELRKLLLALGIMRGPHLLILDEPTNHLDLPAVECLEQALAECPCGLLLVSHDMDFLGRLARTRWQAAGGRVTVGPWQGTP